MVRINILPPKQLTDQHLIAEYNEILMLLGHTKKYPNIKTMPSDYCLGKGHITFFKNKLLYIKKRHEKLKKEMRKRGYTTNKTIDLSGFKKELINDWKPKDCDKKLIRKRIIHKLMEKPNYYTYYGEHKPLKALIKLITH
ncbi:MAG: pyrimidine dimer DNA glycosylase/endonuclease V [Candidatus Woesearchaeota archaeon]